ncbi:shikimate dehydrogenase [Acuticoccus sp.]|uniref:shikimate dehydrogenase n=1 Tax=Acuticoccus sp. TaxID=1904378 RepID=UPI003B52BFDE
MTVRVGLIGWPVTHSRSPVIFAHWFARHGIDARYDLLPVEPGAVERFLADLPGAGLAGVNVTAPHKVAAAACVACDPVATRLGSVNTVWREDGVLAGTSSDGAGFLASLDQGAPRWRDGRRALVLGAGGAAIAVADALAAAGMAVAVANRTAARADALADRIGGTSVPWGSLGGALDEADVFVNATSLGMTGAEPLELDLAPLPSHAVVADIVYNPLATPLLEAAAARGHATVDGLGMLLHQARVGFERWFGVVPEVDGELRRTVEATL